MKTRPRKVLTHPKVITADELPHPLREWFLRQVEPLHTQRNIKKGWTFCVRLLVDSAASPTLTASAGPVRKRKAPRARVRRKK